MTSPFRLQTLLDLSHARLDDAARRLGQLLSSEQEGQRKLDLLAQYRDEYHARFLEAAKDGMTPDQWQNFRAFLDKLDEAIAQQQRAVAISRQLTAKGQQAWLDQRGKAKAYDTLSDRHRAHEQRREGRIEQHATDEHAAKRRPGEEGRD